MKDKANKGYWQRLAKIYAPLMESDKKFYNAICGYIRDYLKSDMNVLELACGTGQLSFPLSDCTNSWTATDFSENMIKQAKRRGTTEKLSFCVADATALSYENENFDCVVISNALHIMPEPEKAMQEIRRVLKKDGILYAPTFLWAEKKSSGLRKRLMSITGFNWFIKRTGNASAIMYFGINDSKEFANKCSMELLEEKTFFPEALKMLGKKLSFVTKVSMKVAEKKKQVIILRLKLN